MEHEQVIILGILTHRVCCVYVWCTLWNPVRLTQGLCVNQADDSRPYLLGPSELQKDFKLELCVYLFGQSREQIWPDKAGWHVLILAPLNKKVTGSFVVMEHFCISNLVKVT